MGEREEQIFPVTARVCEVGREGGISMVKLDVGRGHVITITGISDTLVKQFARSLFKPVTVSFEVHDE